MTQKHALTVKGDLPDGVKVVDGKFYNRSGRELDPVDGLPVYGRSGKSLPRLRADPDRLKAARDAKVAELKQFADDGGAGKFDTA